MINPKERLWEIVEKFIEDNHISCPEAIGQCDWVITNAYDLIEDICNIVGYYEDKEC